MARAQFENVFIWINDVIGERGFPSFQFRTDSEWIAPLVVDYKNVIAMLEIRQSFLLLEIYQSSGHTIITAVLCKASMPLLNKT